MPSFIATIRGRVQGVGYRFYAQRCAHELGICGYVKNLPDENVEAAASGDKILLRSFIAKLEKGPSMAIVDAVDCIWNDDDAAYEGFTIRY